MSLILLYHRVTRLASDPQLLCVSPEHFAEHLEVIRRVGTPMPLAKIAADLSSGIVSPTGIAVTFDDGYADNALEAAPLLERQAVPATIFATTGLTGTHDEFFWDELERIFLQPGVLPSLLSIGDHHADLNGAGSYSATDFAQSARWNLLDPNNPTARQKIYRELTAVIHENRLSRREVLLGELRYWANGQITNRQTHRMMTSAELRDIVRTGLISVGGHTIDHPVLSREDMQVQREQIVGNRDALQAMCARAVPGFSYPFGTRKDYTPETISIVQQAGYDFACANFASRISQSTDLFQLPRYIVRDWAGDEFERRLSQWMAN